jgi:CubicO group peptidase (beta-lactamase class C family)
MLFSWMGMFNSCAGVGGSNPNESAGTEKSNTDSIQNALIFKKINGPVKALQMDSFFNWKVKYQHFNGAILVAQYGQIIYKNVHGYADYENKIDINDHTSFQLASVSKQFTAVAIMQLMEKNMISLDDTVQAFYPDFPYPHITIKLLLSHRSGMPNYLNFASLYWKNKSEFMSNQDLMQMIATYKPARAAMPNARFEYCNTNYAILAAIVEKISGMKFSNYMTKNVFEPLEMKDSWIYTPENFIGHSNKALGYSASGWRRGGFDFTDGVAGDKGVYTSIDDLWLWDRAMYNFKLLKKETLEMAYMPRSFEKHGMKNYGYGWRMIVYSPTQKAVYHNGWWHQFNNAYFRGLNDMTTIIVLGNTSNFSNYQIQPMLDICAGKGECTKPQDLDAEDMEK